jgi:hypothetical protein
MPWSSLQLTSSYTELHWVAAGAVWGKFPSSFFRTVGFGKFPLETYHEGGEGVVEE